MRPFLCFFILFFNNTVFAQAINDRWIGKWQDGNAQLLISSTAFNKCRWVGSRPKTNTNEDCVAYYDGSISKSELIDSLKNDIDLINRSLKEKFMNQKEYKEAIANTESTRRILDQISNDKFRTIVLDYGAGANPDCVGKYFLDQKFVYSTTSCQGGMGSMFNLTQFKKT